MSILVRKNKKTGPSGRTKPKKGSQTTSFIKDSRFPKLIGVALTLVGIFVLVSGISYVFTWKVDQDKILNYPFAVLGEGDLIVSNWLGRLGAVVGNALIYWGFGITSLVLPVLIIGFGLRKLVGAGLATWYTRAGKSILTMVYFSMLFGFLFSSANFPWGGAFGESTTTWLSKFMGNSGVILALLFILIATIIIQFNPSFNVKGEFLAVPDIKVPNWKLSFSELGLDFLKKKKADSITTEIMTSDEAMSENVNEENATIKKGILQPGFLDLFMKKIEKKEKVLLDDEDEDEADDIDIDLLEIEEDDQDAVTMNPELEISGLPDPAEIAEAFSEAHIPPTFSGVQDKVFLMDQENDEHSEPYDPTLELSSYIPPELELLLEYPDEKIQIDRAEVEANKDQIIETLLNYKIEITKIRATIGPTVTLYEIIPKPGIRISKIKNLEDDIALSLSALGIRIIAPIPGKGTIGIEVPNKRKQIVSLKEVLASEKFISGKMDLPVALGKTISNEVFVADLTKMPHLLIAGATGQGKSVGINTVLMSLLYRKHPSQLKLVLIDPKKVELFPYAKLANHFLAFLPDQKEPIVTETKKVIYTLNSLCIEMDDRYDLLKKAHARNLKEYNEKFVNRQLNPLKGHRFMPFIVLVIDEFADLIMTAGKEVEMPIARLAQLARAVGIHLIIATQRPSVNIITGVIKANFPARLAYKVASKVDSRTILDMGGAEQLIGQGDMLLSIGSNMIRLQCAFVDTPEVETVINHIADQKGYPEPFYLPEYVGDDEPIAGADGMTYSELDDMFEDAARLVIQNQHGSTSMIQRRLKLGYNRAGRIMDQLEAVGVVGPADGSKPRDVLMYTEADFDMLISRMRNKN
ncbi:MAG TPA: DNA translocase FtsK [Saprospiraceae bacterium]|nr:DNA translocase FtsK [Saprospiraceae bacterium]